MLERVIDEAKRRGVRFLRVRPVARNVEAISFFYDAGFRSLGQIELLMELRGRARLRWKRGMDIHGREFEY